MAIQKAEVEIRGISAILMNRYPMGPIGPMDKMTREAQAEVGAYRVPGKQALYIPGVALQRALLGGAVYSKGKGRASLQKIVAACVFVTPEYLELGTEVYTIDTRPVVNPTTHGRVIKHRPRLEAGWAVRFELEWEGDLVIEAQMRKVVDDTGMRVGLLDFRPDKKGPFGRFVVTSWKTL